MHHSDFLQVVKTKLHRPSVAPDVEVRLDVLERLDQGSEHPLTLISAPAGYGKTTLISAWIESQDRNYAWMSLDRTDDEPRQFLVSVVSALRAVIPDTFPKLVEALKADDLLPIGILADLLVSGLYELGPAFVLVLDDYHQIRDQELHDLIEKVIKECPLGFRLVLVSRHDPPLPLAKYRAQSRITELRQTDLELGLKEASAFLSRAVGWVPDPKEVSALHTGTEGWPVGLRLGALALRGGGRERRLGLPFVGDTGQVRDYLLTEVLEMQSSSLRRSLLLTSVLERFNASLCEAVIAVDGDNQTVSGEAFLRAVEESGLFAVSLDPQRQWYRYHHLFQELLYQEFAAHASQMEIGRAHRAAAQWHEQEGLLEDALRHYLLVPDSEAAVRLVTRHRHELMEREERVRLKKLRLSLPNEDVEHNVELALAEAWEWENTGQIDRSAEAVERVEAQLERVRLPESEMRALRAEIDALRCALYCEGDADGSKAVASGRRALEMLPPAAVNQRGFTLLYLCIAMQMVGEYSEGRAILLDALGGDPGESSNKDGSVRAGLPLTLHGRILAGLCAAQWLQWDLRSLSVTASSYFVVRRDSDLGESERLARYWQGVSAYYLGDLVQAESSLAPLVDLGLLQNETTMAHGLLALASTYQAMGRPDEADEVVESVARHGLESRDSNMVQLATGFRADLMLRRGHIAEAVELQRSLGRLTPRSTWRFYDPRLTLAKAWIAEDTTSSMKKATELLVMLETLYESVHNRRGLIETLALCALVAHAESDQAGALCSLSRAVELAMPSGGVRLFTDLGTGLVPLLHRLEGDENRLTYAGRIIAAFSSTAQSEPVGDSHPPTTRNLHLLEPLSVRELEVLELFSQRLSNRETGERLFVSTYTVKSHARAIYDKLGVHGRAEAVAKAKGLGILPSRPLVSGQYTQ